MKKSIASRWWPERLRIAICPDRVVVARLRLDWRSRVFDKRVFECSAEPSSEHSWQAPLAVLGAVLDGIESSNTAVTIVLSSHFVRYAIVPWRDSIANRTEQAALARHCFKNIYGDVAATWDIRVSDSGFRRNAVASATDRQLVARLDQLFAEKKVTLSSMQPYFMTVCNRFQKELKTKKSGCLAVLEPGRVTLAIFDHKGWQALTVRRISEVNAESLAPLLQQEINSANLAVAPEILFVVALEAPKLDLTSRAWSAQALQLRARRGFSPFEDARYAMAVCGAA